MRKNRPLFGRQKLLLSLIQAFGGSLRKVDLQKYLFLFTETYRREKSYEFVPYRFGCFSFQSYADLGRLSEAGIVIEEERYWRLADGGDYMGQIGKEERENLLSFRDGFKNLRGDDLVRHVYRSHPYYAIKSEIARGIMSDDELDAIDAARPADENFAFFTIGYEGRSFDNYLNRLVKNNIKVLCDVRRNAFSRKYGFSKSTLSENLKKLGIDYVHMPELGIVSEKRLGLKTRADYDRLFDDYELSTLRQNGDALDKLERIFLKYKRVAITCFEASHRMCHRGRVAKAMSGRPGWDCGIVHI